jgi:cell division septal protein FtsQ
VKKWVWWGVAALAIVVAGSLTPFALRRMTVFRVRRIEVIGARYLTAADVGRAAKLGPKANLFEPTEPIRKRVMAMPGVARVEVHRRIPGALVFEIGEFEPVAMTMSAGKLALVDRRGRILPYDPTRSPEDLPIAEPDSAVTGLIDRVKDVDPALSAEVLSGSRSGSTITLETAKHRLLFRVGATTKDIQGAAAVVTELARRQLAVAEVDARFEGRVVVRGRGA